MAHEIDETTGRAAFTWIEGTPLAWHGLGTMTAKDDAHNLDVVGENAGLNWNAYASPLYFSDNGQFHKIDGQTAIVRNDTHKALGTASDSRYHIHQPAEILRFFKRFIDGNRMTMETAGALRGGRVIFALARMSDEFATDIGGVDKILPYFLLGTSFDGSLATHGAVTSIRVVCANTHRAMMNQTEGNRFRQKHSSMFDAASLQATLEIAGIELKERARIFNQLADTAMTADQVNEFFIKDVLNIDPEDLSKFGNDGKPKVSNRSRNIIKLLQDSYTNGPGADIARGTAWGAYNAVTHFVDHTARTRDTNGDGANIARLNSAWYGNGATVKKQAIERLMTRVAIAA